MPPTGQPLDLFLAAARAVATAFRVRDADALGAGLAALIAAMARLDPPPE